MTKKTDRQKAIVKLDKLWAETIKERAGYKCEYCGRTQEQTILASHHIFSRRHLGTRWDVNNGVCLCTQHHIFLAHRDTATFMLWVQRKLGQALIDVLEMKAHSVAKFHTKDLKIFADNWNKLNQQNTGDLVYSQHISDEMKGAANAK
jgi:hypothetical protein